MGHFRESIPMGQTRMREEAVLHLIDQLSCIWQGNEYDLLRKNCTGFCDELCVKLGAGNIPAWISNLAAAGATISDGAIRAVSTAQKAAIVAAAKANQINQMYRGAIQARASDFVAMLQNLEHSYPRLKTSAESCIGVKYAKRSEFAVMKLET